jgi:hypothetical protein
MANGCQAAQELALRCLTVRRVPNFSVAESIKRNGCCNAAHVGSSCIEVVGGCD